MKRGTCGAAAMLLLAATPLAAAPRWGVECGPRMTAFVSKAPPAPLGVSVTSETRRLAGAGGGVRAEWKLARTWTSALLLRYEESGAGRNSAIALFFNGGNVQELVAEEDLRFRYVTFAPELRAGPFAGFGVHVAPELGYLLETRRHTKLTETPPRPPYGPMPTGTIFEAVYGHPLDEDVTSDYQRLQQSFTVGLDWEHRLAAHALRVSADYHRMTSEPRRTTGPEDRMQEWRAGLSWLF